MTIFSVGAFYSLMFIEIGIPTFEDMIPDSSAKTVFMMMIYAIPLFVTLIGMIALFREALKEKFIGGMGGYYR